MDVGKIRVKLARAACAVSTIAIAVIKKRVLKYGSYSKSIINHWGEICSLAVKGVEEGLKIAWNIKYASLSLEKSYVRRLFCIGHAVYKEGGQFFFFKVVLKVIFKTF